MPRFALSLVARVLDIDESATAGVEPPSACKRPRYPVLVARVPVFGRVLFRWRRALPYETRIALLIPMRSSAVFMEFFHRLSFAGRGRTTTTLTDLSETAAWRPGGRKEGGEVRTVPCSSSQTFAA